MHYCCKHKDRLKTNLYCLTVMQYIHLGVGLIKDFGNKAAAELFHRGSTRLLPRQFWKRAVHLLEVMEAVESLDDMIRDGFPPSIRLHLLKGDRKGEWAIDIHKTSGWRITFRFEQKEFVDVKVEDYH